jgi:DNA end-binding protein Ku
VPGGDYVLLSEDEIKEAYPKTTQTIAIESFVQAAEVPFVHLEAPYYLEPQAKGEKAYGLLREAMREAGVIGIARVVMHTREHLCALVPAGPALIVNTLRWAEEIRPWDELKLPAEGRAGAGLKEAELKMARQLIEDMTETFEVGRYDDQFTKAIELLIEQRVESGKTHRVEPMEEGAAPRTGNVVDLTELLKRSLGKRGGAAAADEEDAEAAPRKATRRPARGASRKRA